MTDCCPISVFLANIWPISFYFFSNFVWFSSHNLIIKFWLVPDRNIDGEEAENDWKPCSAVTTWGHCNIEFENHRTNWWHVKIPRFRRPIWCPETFRYWELGVVFQQRLDMAEYPMPSDKQLKKLVRPEILQAVSPDFFGNNDRRCQAWYPYVLDMLSSETTRQAHQLGDVYGGVGPQTATGQRVQTPNQTAWAPEGGTSQGNGETDGSAAGSSLDVKSDGSTWGTSSSA